MVLKLYYWNIRALGEPIRLMLEHMGVEYENNHPDSIEGWFATKFDVGLDFPNLPYLVDGDVKISQSYAVMRYLTRKFKTSEETVKKKGKKIDVAEGVCQDLRMGLILGVWFNPEYETKKAEYYKDLPTKLKALEAVLGKNKWVTGDTLSYVDFAICEALDWHVMMEPDCFKANPNVKKYYDAFFALPKIAAYRKSDRFKSWPVSGGSAGWGNDNKKVKNKTSFCDTQCCHYC